MVGVNSDENRKKLIATMKKQDITWRSFWDGGSTRGPIATKWDVFSWPAIYVLDQNGVIRAKDIRGEALDLVVDRLVEELEKTREK